MKYERGNIWNIELTKSPADTVGHEQGLTRPCLILRNNPQTELTTIIPFTSKLDASRLSYTCTVKKSSKNKLTSDSVALIFQIKLLSHKRFVTYIGEIDKRDLDNILINLRVYLKI